MQVEPNSMFENTYNSGSIMLGVMCSSWKKCVELNESAFINLSNTILRKSLQFIDMYSHLVDSGLKASQK